VLRAAAEQGLLDVPPVLARLKTTNFYVDDALIEAIFQRWLAP
jgi:predicted nucleic acid-binding protein